MMWTLVVVFLIVVGVIFLISLFWWGLKKALVLALNSVIGFFALYALQAFFVDSLIINFWSVLFVALFGIFGLIIVLVLHFLGIWF